MLPDLERQFKAYGSPGCLVNGNEREQAEKMPISTSSRASAKRLDFGKCQRVGVEHFKFRMGC